MRGSILEDDLNYQRILVSTNEKVNEEAEDQFEESHSSAEQSAGALIISRNTDADVIVMTRKVMMELW